MSYWGSKFDMAHSLTTNFGASNFDAATLADNSFEANALVLTAIAFPVASWTEDLLIEESVLFWLKGSVVDGFWLLYFAKRPLADVLS
jgi:hypothetical protein